MHEAFSQNPWFASLAAADADLLLAAAAERMLPAGQMLFRQGDEVPPGTGHFYGLAQGTMKISSLREDGREAILLLLEPGNWFGELSLIDALPRLHDATALEACTLMEVGADAFAGLMQRSSFAAGMTRLLVARTRALHATMELASLRSTRARLAHRLLLMAHGGATLSPQARRMVSVNQESLAMMLGVSRPTLHKELKALSARGAIALRYGRIEVIDEAGLRAQVRG